MILPISKHSYFFVLFFYLCSIFLQIFPRCYIPIFDGLVFLLQCILLSFFRFHEFKDIYVKAVGTDSTRENQELCGASQQLSLLSPPVASAVGPRHFDMLFPSIFYHYSSAENLAGILATGTILPSPPHPATPGRLGASSLKDGAIFLTRMDPTNSKRAIAYNNYR